MVWVLQMIWPSEYDTSRFLGHIDIIWNPLFFGHLVRFCWICMSIPINRIAYKQIYFNVCVCVCVTHVYIYIYIHMQTHICTCMIYSHWLDLWQPAHSFVQPLPSLAKSQFPSLLKSTGLVLHLSLSLLGHQWHTVHYRRNPHCCKFIWHVPCLNIGSSKLQLT